MCSGSPWCLQWPTSLRDLFPARPFDHILFKPDGPRTKACDRLGKVVASDVARGRTSAHSEQFRHFGGGRPADAVAEGRFRPRPSIGFIDWADRWLASLERKPSTVHSYRSTITHAKEAFGGQRVRRIGAEDIAGFNGMLRERGCSPSTRAKHL